MIYHANTNEKRAGVAILLSDKVYSRANNITRNNEGNVIMIKLSINHEDIIILNVYASNYRSSKCLKQKCIKLQEEIGKSIIKVSDFNTTLSN